VEPCLASDEIAIVAEGDTALGVEVGESLDVLVDDGFFHADPEDFGWLQLGRVGRQIDEADDLGNGEWRGVPARAVEHQDDDAVAAGAGLAGEEREGSSKRESWAVSTRERIPAARWPPTQIMSGRRGSNERLRSNVIDVRAVAGGVPTILAASCSKGTKAMWVHPR
jgi:hypothetical protein